MATPFTGMTIAPCWHLVPPGGAVSEGRHGIILNPGAGFGFGEHPSTQLCMQAIAAFAPRNGQAWSMLDFGSGTGVLSIAAAKLGAKVIGVEIDEPALQNSALNLDLNALHERVSFTRTLDEALGPFDMVVANILRPILLEFASLLTDRLASGGTLILAGLVGTDAPDLTVRYAALLQGQRPVVYQKGDWRALVWRGGSQTSCRD